MAPQQGTFDSHLADAQSWFQHAQSLEAEGRLPEAIAACQTALAAWPPVTPVHQMLWRLTQQTGKAGMTQSSLLHLLQEQPEDPVLNGEMGAELSKNGQFRAALPFLRIAAPALGDDRCAIWNYTAALAVEGAYQELIDAQPLLDRACGNPSIAYTPYRHLAGAKLALRTNRATVIRDQVDLEQSPDWLDAGTATTHLARAIAAGTPFSLIRLDRMMARFLCYTSLHAHLLLRIGELAAMADAAWEPWYGNSVETLEPPQVAALAGSVQAAIASADVLGVPTAQALKTDHFHFGFLAEMNRLVIRRDGRFFAGNNLERQLHDLIPFFSDLLQGQPFLGFIGCYPDLVERLGRFCGIQTTVSLFIPTDASKSFLPAPMRYSGAPFESWERAAADLVVPFPGAVFLVSATGPLAAIICGHIKQRGGIALDIGSLADYWEGYR